MNREFCRHIISLTISLALLWCLLSGYYKPLLISSGVVSVLLVVTLIVRMDIVDHEGHPFHLNLLALFAYWAWLLKEIVVANLAVSRLILKPRMLISPTVITLPTSQTSDLGRAILANSITLTPGTVTIDVNDRHVKVHAITKEAAQSLATSAMDRKVSALERDPGGL